MALPKGFKILDVVMVHPSMDHPQGAQVHDHHEIVYLVYGRYKARSGRRTYTLRAGDAIYYPARTKHEPLLRAQRGTRLYILQWIAKEKLVAPGVRTVADRNGRLHALLHWLLEGRRSRPRPPKTVERAQLALLFHEFTALARPRPPGRIERVKTLIAERLSDRFSLDELARAADLSRYHFCRVFRERTGESPIAYQQRLRVERAMELIRTTELPFKEVARLVGLGSATYLSRLVRKYARRSPTELRPRRAR